MEHGLVAWSGLYVIRARLGALTRTGAAFTRTLRERLGLGRVGVRPRHAGSALDAVPRGVDARAPQPLSSFPALRRLVAGDPWFADAGLRAQRVWERDGWAGQRFAFFIVRGGGEPAAGLLLRDRELVYCRLYPAYTLAAVDALFWSREIEAPPDPASCPWRGIGEDGRPWMVRVLPRQHRWELHIAHGSLIPQVCEFSSQEEAIYRAELQVAELEAAAHAHEPHQHEPLSESLP
jgi:hypothetical protein